MNRADLLDLAADAVERLAADVRADNGTHWSRATIEVSRTMAVGALQRAGWSHSARNVLCDGLDAATLLQMAAEARSAGCYG